VWRPTALMQPSHWTRVQVIVAFFTFTMKSVEVC